MGIVKNVSSSTKIETIEGNTSGGPANKPKGSTCVVDKPRDITTLPAIKGGVGKTTIASSLASDLVNNFGKKVLLVDANYSAPNLGLHMDIVEPGKTIHDVLAGKTCFVRTGIHS